MSVLRLNGLVKSFGNKKVLDGLDFVIDSATSCALLGRSGSGKTTLARIICGLEKSDHGNILFGSNCVPMLVPQDFVIWPHLTVRKNVAAGYRGPDSKKDQLIASWLDRLGLLAMAEQLAGKLSFGEQQRVSLARAFCFSPQLMVLDEPLAHLDAPARSGLVTELRQLCFQASIALLWITHDAREAFAAGDQVAVLQDGRILQTAAPETIYRHPTTREIGELTGEISWLDQTDWDFIHRTKSPQAEIALPAGKRFGLRPEWLSLAERSETGWVMSHRAYVGPGYIYLGQLPSGATLKVFHPEILPLGESWGIRVLKNPCIA